MTETTIIKTEEITAGLHLADSLRREGKYAEARAVIADELSSLAASDVAGRLACACMSATVERSAGDAVSALRILLEASRLADECSSPERLAKYRHGLGYTYQLLNDCDRALIEYAGASDSWADAENYFEAGCTENNVALIQLGLNRLEDAREHVNRARAYSVDMPVKSAEVDETEAQLLLAEGKPFEALRMVNRAVEVFYAHGETELIRKALPTLIKAAADCQCEAVNG